MYWRGRYLPLFILPCCFRNPEPGSAAFPRSYDLSHGNKYEKDKKYNMSHSRLHILRRLSQIAFIAVVILVPVLDVFRFDAASGNLIVLGSQWNLGLDPEVLLNPSFQNSSRVAWHVFLKALLPWIVVLSVFPLLGAVLGRFFCGWFCPEGAIFELFDYLTLRVFGRRSLFSKKMNDPEGKAKNRVPYIIVALIIKGRPRAVQDDVLY